MSQGFGVVGLRTINVYADDGTGPADDEVTSIVRIKLNDSKAANDADDADDLLPTSSGSKVSVTFLATASSDADSPHAVYPVQTIT
jgi:hypothetical protein